MRRHQLVFLIVLTLGVAMVSACGPSAGNMTSQEALVKIKEGMTPDDVRGKLGSPGKTKNLGEAKQVFVYSTSDRKVVIYFTNNEVSQFRATDRVQFR